MNDLNKKLILSFLIVFFLGIVALFTLREATESKIQNLNVVSSVPSFELVNFNENNLNSSDQKKLFYEIIIFYCP